MKKTAIIEKLKSFGGETSLYFENIKTGEVIDINADRPLMAASVIKIPIMIEVFRQIKIGRISAETKYILKKEDKKPSCGCLNRLHDGTELTVRDLYNLMIILSDNSATNILIDILGREQINASMKEMGFESIQLNRYLFDREASARGIQNYVSTGDIACIFKKMYEGTLVDGASSKEMMEVLCEQRLNGKIPFFFDEDILIAHKTGEDDFITHDCALFLSGRPFILCIMGNGVNVPMYERFMQDIAGEFYEYVNG